MSTVLTCPSVADFQQFLLGASPESAAEHIERHLADCPRCVETLNGLKVRDAFTDALRAQEELPMHDADVEQLIARLCAAPPPVDAAADHAPRSFAFLAPAESSEELGRLGGYRVTQFLGEGGMGIVFRAEDPGLQRTVALKVMKPALAAHPDARQRFLREAWAMAALKNEHIVTVHQVGEDGLPYLAMEYLQGESLDVYLARGRRLAVPQILRLGKETARGLAAAHGRGLIHRDIKPGNIWLEAPAARVKIVDFGLARSVGDNIRMTKNGAILGTPAYMAPEQAAGETVDPRCDLFSLGCVLYQLCTGQLPFEGENTMAVLVDLALHTPQPVHAINPEVPAKLSLLVSRLLAKNREERPTSARAVIEEIEAIELETKARADDRQSVLALAPHRSFRFRLVGAFVVFALISVTIFAAGIVIRVKGPESKETEITAPEGSRVEIKEDASINVNLPASRQAASKAHGKDSESFQPRMRVDVTEKTMAEPGGIKAFEQGRRSGQVDVGVLMQPPKSYDDLRTFLGMLKIMPRDGKIDFYPQQLIQLLEILKPEKTTQSNQQCTTCHTASAQHPDPKTKCTRPSKEASMLDRLLIEDDLETLKGVIRDTDIPKLKHVLKATTQTGPIDLKLPLPLARLAAATEPGRWDNVRSVALTVQGQRGAITAVAFHPDGTRVATAGTDNVTRIWEVANGKLGTHLGGRDAIITSLAWSPDGKMLAMADADGSIFAHDFTTQNKAFSTGGLEKGVRTVVWSPDGKTLATASTNNPSVTLCHSDNGAARQSLLEESGSGITTLAWSPSGNLLACGTTGNHVRVWDIKGGKAKHRFEAPFYQVSSVRWSPDGKMLAAAGKDGTLTLWELKSDFVKQLAHIPMNTPIAALAWSPDGRTLAVGISKHVSFDGGGLRPSVRFHLLVASSLAWSADGNILVGGGPNGSVRVWDGASGKQLGALYTQQRNGGPMSLGLAMSATGHYRLSDAALESDMKYLVEGIDGQSTTMTPEEFAKQYGWKNDPEKARFIVDR